MDQETRDGINFGLYRSSLLSFNQWIEKAEALLQAAALLEPSVDEVWESRIARVSDPSRPDALPAGILVVHLMLVAFGIENTLKGLIVRTNPSSLLNEFEMCGQLPARLKTHRLMDLARLSGFEPTPDEEALLRRLTRAAYWAARYPIPVRVSDRPARETFRDGVQRPVVYNWPGDVAKLKALVARIRSHAASGAA